MVPRAQGVGIDGLDLAGGDVQVYSMARTLSPDPNQVTQPGRRTMIGWRQVCVCVCVCVCLFVCVYVCLFVFVCVCLFVINVLSRKTWKQ